MEKSSNFVFGFEWEPWIFQMKDTSLLIVMDYTIFQLINFIQNVPCGTWMGGWKLKGWYHTSHSNQLKRDHLSPACHPILPDPFWILNTPGHLLGACLAHVV